MGVNLRLAEGDNIACIQPVGENLNDLTHGTPAGKHLVKSGRASAKMTRIAVMVREDGTAKILRNPNQAHSELEDCGEF